EFYHRFSDKIHDILQKMREGKLADLEALRQMKVAREAVINKKDDSLPAEIDREKGADIFYRNLRGPFEQHAVNNTVFVGIVLEIFSLLKQESIVDWHKNAEVKRVMANKIDDYLYDIVVTEKGIALSSDEMSGLVKIVMDLAENNHEIF
ncbi:MAG: hypothetical protein Q8Q33_02540, partial [Chlamydiota bacterium]|nr:hypothetical protein [Chlamydiota bacterium]